MWGSRGSQPSVHDKYWEVPLLSMPTPSPSWVFQVDREALCSHSKFFCDMLGSCDSTGNVKVDESL